MANIRLVCFTLAVVLVASVFAEQKHDSHAESKILQNHIIHTGDVDRKAFDIINGKNQAAEQQQQQQQQQPMVQLLPAAKVSDDQQQKQQQPEQVPQGLLQPILPMIKGMSPFLSSIIAGSDDNIASDQQQQQQQQSADDLIESMSNRRPHGVMTIVLMKSFKSSRIENGAAAESESNSVEQNGNANNANGEGEMMPNPTSTFNFEIRPNLNFLLNHLLPRRLSQMFGLDEKSMQLIGADDLDRTANQHLLGGKHDVDHFRMFGTDVDESGDDTQLQPDELIAAGGQEPSFILRTENIVGRPAFGMPNTDDVVAGGHHNRPPAKKCMMMSFMRLKASAYYRTVVHLLFFSGIFLLILFVIILSIRVYRRRRALRFYRQNMMHVASVTGDESLSGHRSCKRGVHGNLYMFRLGSLKNSYAQKLAEANESSNRKSSMLFTAPPAYEQIISTNNNNKNEEDDDVKSVTSLPAYADALAQNQPPKSNDA